MSVSPHHAQMYSACSDTTFMCLMQVHVHVFILQLCVMQLSPYACSHTRGAARFSLCPSSTPTIVTVSSHHANKVCVTGHNQAFSDIDTHGSCVGSALPTPTSSHWYMQPQVYSTCLHKAYTAPVWPTGKPTCRLPSIGFCHGCAVHFRTWVQASALLVPGLSPPQPTLALPPGGPSLVCMSSGHSTLSQTEHNRDRKQDGEEVQPRLLSCAGTSALAIRMEQNPASPYVGREGRCSLDPPVARTSLNLSFPTCGLGTTDAPWL